MKLSFTEKLILESVRDDGAGLKLFFVSYLREDYIGRALTLSIDGKKRLEKIYFSSNDFGTASWINKYGLTESHRWENEDDLVYESTLTQRFPVIIEDGITPAAYAMGSIIPDVLENLLDLELSGEIKNIIQKKSTAKILDWEKIIERNKILTDGFIEEYLKLKKKMR
jgi:hypothetical protein